MTRRQVVVVEPGQGDRVGNVELLARTVDTPYFNLGVVTLAPGQGVPGHVHDAEDDSWLVLDGTLTVTVGEDRRVQRAGAGTFVLVPAGTHHALDNEGPDDVRFLNVHAPGGFDRRIGWRPRRVRVTASALLATAALVLAVSGGPASAAALTVAKVQQIAAKVAARTVQQQAPTLSVASARTAEEAEHASDAERAETADSADDALSLAGRGAESFLDRVAFTRGTAGGTNVGGTFVAVAPAGAVEVPAGVGYVRVTGVAVFTGGNNSVTLQVVAGPTCSGGFDPAMSVNGSTFTSQPTLVVDRVVPVAPGVRTFVLCGWAWNPMGSTVSSATSTSLTIETVAVGTV